MDLFQQIFLYEEYHCLSKLQSPALIFDLGAKVGYSSAYFLSRFPDCQVIAVEPDPDNYLTLEANVSEYK